MNGTLNCMLLLFAERIVCCQISDLIVYMNAIHDNDNVPGCAVRLKQ